MRVARRLVPLLLAVVAAGWTQPGRADGQVWWAYRDAYRALVRYHKLASPKHLIQQQLQVQALAPDLATDGLRLTLSGSRTALELPLDAALHTSVPLLKSAYDDNAVLRLNRGPEAFALRVRVSISPRADGQYAVSELRQACEQALQVQRQIEPDRHRGKRCVGVSLAFGRHSDPGVNLRQGAALIPLPVVAGPLYPGEAERGHAVVTLRWDRLAEGGQVVAPSLPLVIAPLWE